MPETSVSGVALFCIVYHFPRLSFSLLWGDILGYTNSMVWKKKKQPSVAPVSSEYDREGGAMQREPAGAMERSPRAGGEAVGSLTTAGLTARNLDSTRSEWEVNEPGFSLPVHHRTSHRPYIIPRNYRISGAISSERQVLVCGEFAQGVLEAPTLTVAPGGLVKGQVIAASVQVAGTVDASVRALASVEVSGGGRVTGELQAPAMKVWPGAILQAAITASREIDQRS
jgi:cytoskeletal protein CcmA (bactofilin family)